MALGVTIGILATPAVKYQLGWAPDPGALPSYVVGSAIDVSPSAFSDHSRTVLLFARSSCEACQQSKPMMAGLVRDLSALTDVGVRLVSPIIGQEDQKIFARELGLEASSILPIHTNSIRLKRVPATVVVDRAGAILAVREGVLTESDRRDIVRAAGDPGPPEAKSLP